MITTINEFKKVNEHNEDKMLYLISKYIKDPDDIQKELVRYKEYGFQGFTDLLKANLNRDDEFISYTQMTHDENTLRDEINESEGSRYMFFSNAEQIKRQMEYLLEFDKNKIEEILNNGHDWAQDHMSEAKNNIDQVFDFLMNELKSETNLNENNLNENTKIDWNDIESKLIEFSNTYSKEDYAIIRQTFNFLKGLLTNSQNTNKYFDLNPEQLKGNSEMKRVFINSLLTGPKKFTHLFSGAWQNPSKFRNELENANVIVRDENNLYDFTPEYKNRHNLN